MSDVFVDITTTEELVSVNAATTEEVVSVTGQTTEEVVQITIEVMTCTPSTILLNGGAFLTVASGGTADVELLDEDGAPVIPVSVVGSTITVPNAGGEVVLERTDGSEVATVVGPTDFELNDLIITVEDNNDNVLITTNQMVYTQEEIDLTILASCNVIIGQNTDVEIVNTLPPSGIENTIYFLIQ